MRELPLPTWPGGASVAVSLTFDVDGESSWLPQYADRLSTISEARYGITRGLPRILDLLARHNIQATFYVPGDTADRHPEAVRGIAQVGHEIGHHGHLHLRSHQISEADQRREIEQGLESLSRHAGVTPRGYRSPAWELTPQTLALLTEHGFAYDSSCMGDDRPYVEEHGALSILELPVHWSLDDWPHFAWHPDKRGQLGDPEAVFRAWWAEFEAARRERRHVTYTMHPEVIGRGHRFEMLCRLVERILETGDAWFAAHGEVAAAVTESAKRS